MLLETNDEWATQHRHMQVEAMAGLLERPLIEGEAALTDPAAVAPEVS